MQRETINKNGKNISLYGSKAIIQRDKIYIENLELTGIEGQDRLIIQKCIDDNKLKSDILYDGNTVYPFESIVKKYRQMQVDGTLSKLTDKMYKFFMNACGDIAHYNMGGYIAYYNNSFKNLESELLAHCWDGGRFTDRDRIFKELKIGQRYYKEREFIDINNVSLDKLKSIIKECGWDINESNKYWNFSKNISEKDNYSFDLDILTCNVSDVVRNINYIANSFNKDNYCERVYEEKEKADRPTMSEIVSLSNNIKYSLNKLASDVLYKAKIASEIINSEAKKLLSNDIDLEPELER